MELQGARPTISPLSRARSALALAVALGVMAACGPGERAPAPTAPIPATGVASVPRCGVAGLIPAGFPEPTTEQWSAFYESLAETGGALGVYTSRTDSDATRGSVPAVVAASFASAARFGFTPLVGLGAARDAAAGRVVPTVDLRDPASRELFVRAMAEVARAHRPAYLAIGGEVNRLYESDADAFEAFVAGYEDAYHAVKAASPETRVFTVFQLEMMRGEGFLLGGSEVREPQWDLIARFGDTLDLVGFTTYPFFDFERPADIPDDYYADAAARAGLPVAFTEVGWPSAPLSTAPASGYGGTPDEQAAFVERFFELTAVVRPAIALWAFAHDIGPGHGPAFEHTGLRAGDGTPKPALAAWRDGCAESR